jgi:hypothetical protein
VKLQLGVLDVAYTDPGSNRATTTGDVAEYLEDDYHVMRTFLELNEDKIGEQLADAAAGAIESFAQGKPADFELSGPMNKIEEEFRDYLDRGDWRKASGQTIQAADAGVSHRKKHPNAKKNKARTAFVDTGLYQSSFRAWLET